MSKYTKDIKDLSLVELDEKATDLKQELFNLRFQHAVKQLENTTRITTVKRQIAAIKTIKRTRELSGTVSGSVK